MTLPSKETHKPTFHVTAKRRPWYRRLTPAARLLLGIGCLTGLIVALGLFRALYGERDIPFVLPPTRTPAVTPSPTAPPTPSPTSTPEAWVWWADEMRCDERGNCTPPLAVVDEILSAYWAWKEALPLYIDQLDMTPEQLAQYYTGEMLDLQTYFVSSVLERGTMWDGETLITEYEYETRVPHVAGCRPDGLSCLVGETLQGDVTLHRYNLATRQIAETIPNPEDRQYRGVNIWCFKYDLEEDKWKVERYIEWVPAP